MNLPEISFTLISFLATIISLYGFGTLITIIAFPEWRRYFGINTLLGLVLFLAISGLIELGQLGSRQAFHGFIYLGLALALSNTISTYIQKNEPYFFWAKFRPDARKIVAIAIATAFVIAYCINMMLHAFNFGDDYSSYLLFPLRILNEGFSGGDAFNLRGIEHGLGGGDYVNALFLSTIDLRYLYLAESGMGFLLLGLLCIDYARINRQGFWISYTTFVVAYITAIFAQYTNVTPILSGCAVGYGMLLIGQRMPPKPSLKLSFLLGLFCGALIVLKANLLAPALMFLGVIFLFRLIELRKRWVIGEIAVCITATLIIMLPWMLASKMNHGTLFYPLLGKGFTYSGGFALVPMTLFWSAAQEFIPLYSLTFANWFIFWARSQDTRQIRFISILCLALVPCTLILALTPAGMYRYCYVILATPCLYIVINNLCIYRQKVCKSFFGLSISNTRYLVLFVIFVCSILMLHQTKRVGGHFFRDSLYTRHFAIDQNKLLDTDMLSKNFPSTAQRYLNMQNSIPLDSVTLVQIEAPFLLDYSRNQIWVMDYPGSAGPSPLPYEGTAEDLAAYFRDHNIRYIMHSYKAWLTRINSNYYIQVESNPAYEWNKGMVKREANINSQLLQLSDNYPKVYDDGIDRVIDLCSKQFQANNLCQ